MKSIIQPITFALWLFMFSSSVSAHESSDYYGSHMMWQGYGMFFGPMMIVFIILAVILGVFLFRWLGSSASSQNSGAYRPTERDPIDILKERFANGEIDKEEFEERKRLLREK